MIFHGYSVIEHGWNWMEDMKLWMNHILWMEYEYTSMIFFQWTYFTLKSHEISSQELWLNVWRVMIESMKSYDWMYEELWLKVWRVMTEGPSVHQPKFMNEIACMLIHGIYIKLNEQLKLWMHFCEWNKTTGDISWKKVFHFQTKQNFIQLFHFI
jgi:hypothetical protein